MQATAQGWLVLGLTNSAALLGLTSAAANLPMLLLSLYAGVLADRVDQRRLLVVTQIAAAIFTAILALLTTLGVVEFWHVVVVAFLVGCTSAMSSPAYQALVSTIVGPRALGNAIALNSAQFNLSRIVGPSFAGIGIALGGLALSFWANSLSFVIVAIVLATLPIRNARAIGRLEASLWANIADGLRYVRGAPPIPTLLLLTIAPALLNLNYLVFLPIFARDVLGIGAAGLGLMTSAVGVGAVIGALAVAVARPGGGSGRLVIAALIASSTGLLLFAVSTWLPLTLLGLAILGGCQVGYYATTNTLLQLLVPIRLRGRVMSLYIITSTGLTPLGNIVIGPIADRVGVQPTLAGCALITILVCCIVALRSRSLRELQAQAVATPA
jgi:MFS family permease